MSIENMFIQKLAQLGLVVISFSILYIILHVIQRKHVINIVNYDNKIKLNNFKIAINKSRIESKPIFNRKYKINIDYLYSYNLFKKPKAGSVVLYLRIPIDKRDIEDIKRVVKIEVALSKEYENIPVDTLDFDKLCTNPEDPTMLKGEDKSIPYCTLKKVEHYAYLKLVTVKPALWFSPKTDHISITNMVIKRVKL